MSRSAPGIGFLGLKARAPYIDARLPEHQKSDADDKNDRGDVIEEDHQQGLFVSHTNRLERKSRPKDEAAGNANEASDHHDEPGKNHQEQIIPCRQDNPHGKSGPEKMRCRHQLAQDGCNDGFDATHAVARPDDAVAERSTKAWAVGSNVRRYPIEAATDQRPLVCKQDPEAKQRPKEAPEQEQVQASRDTEAKAQITLDLRDASNHGHDPCEQRKDDSIEKTRNDRGGQHRCHLQPVHPGDQPCPHQRADPQWHQHVGTVTGQQCTGQPDRTDRLDVVEDLPPFPAAQKLLEQDCRREDNDPERIGRAQALKKPSEIKAPVEKGYEPERQRRTKNRQQPASEKSSHYVVSVQPLLILSTLRTMVRCQEYISRRGRNMATTTISAAAREAGIGVETIRFYERKGLIDQPPRPVQGARDYGGETLGKLKFISGAKELGFSLAEVAELLDLQQAPNPSCRVVQGCARAKREDVQTRIEGLLRLRDTLDDLIAACPGNGGIEYCSILNAINGVGKARSG